MGSLWQTGEINAFIIVAASIWGRITEGGRKEGNAVFVKDGTALEYV